MKCDSRISSLLSIIALEKRGYSSLWERGLREGFYTPFHKTAVKNQKLTRKLSIKSNKA
jgi:hypothetical protein